MAAVVAQKNENYRTKVYENFETLAAVFSQRVQSSALLVEIVGSEPQLWTVRVSRCKQNTVFAGMNTVQVQSSCLKVKRISYSIRK